MTTAKLWGNASRLEAEKNAEVRRWERCNNAELEPARWGEQNAAEKSGPALVKRLAR